MRVAATESLPEVLTPADFCGYSKCMNTAANTPGYSTRLGIYFATNKNGQRCAYRFSPTQFRAFRMNLAQAEEFIAQDQAELLDGNPVHMLAAM